MMKNFNIFKKDFYINFIYFLLASSILANFSQIIMFKYKFGNFNLGELIIIMFNDSYTGYFTFPFLLLFILMIESPIEENIFFLLVRFDSRKHFYKHKHNKVIKILVLYLIFICLFSIITNIVNFNIGNNISLATIKFAEIYLSGHFETNNLILEILKIIILQGLLLYLFTLMYLFLTQFKISQSLVFIIYTTVLIIMAGMSLGFFGKYLKQFSVFYLASSINNHNISFVTRLILFILIDLMLFLLNFKIFKIKDISLPKGSKQYQNE